MTIEEFSPILQVLIQQDVEKFGTQQSLAAEIGITPQFLHDVIKGTRPPTGKVLSYYRVNSRMDYEFVRWTKENYLAFVQAEANRRRASYYVFAAPDLPQGFQSIEVKAAEADNVEVEQAIALIRPQHHKRKAQ